MTPLALRYYREKGLFCERKTAKNIDREMLGLIFRDCGKLTYSLFQTRVLLED